MCPLLQFQVLFYGTLRYVEGLTNYLHHFVHLFNEEDEEQIVPSNTYCAFTNDDVDDDFESAVDEIDDEDDEFESEQLFAVKSRCLLMIL